MNLEQLSKILMRLCQSVGTCRDAGDETGALILLYTYCDSIASLTRSANQVNSTSEHFKHYVESYLLPNSSIKATSSDLWSGRCGIVHNFSPYSTMTERKNDPANIIVYVGSEQQAKICEDTLARSDDSSKFVFIDPYDLINAFIDSVVDFLKALQNDVQLVERVLSHADSMFFSYTIKLSDGIGADQT